MDYKGTTQHIVNANTENETYQLTVSTLLDEIKDEFLDKPFKNDLERSDKTVTDISSAKFEMECEPLEKTCKSETLIDNSKVKIEQPDTESELQPSKLEPEPKALTNEDDQEKLNESFEKPPNINTMEECSRKRNYENPSASSSNNHKKRNKNYYFLEVSEFPLHWSCERVEEYLKTEKITFADIVFHRDVKGDFISEIQLEFSSYEERQLAKEHLDSKEIEGKKLSADFHDSDGSGPDSGSDLESDLSEPVTKRARENLPAWRPETDLYSVDPKGLYGLKLSFLKSLHIKPPIDRWVRVSNVRSDKALLREILDMAGKVVICNMHIQLHNYLKYADVLYSHPLEAVQAISMFHGKKFYGICLKVVMVPAIGDSLLPKGLATVGPGLGLHGKPLSNVVKQCERFFQGHSSLVNQEIFVNSEENTLNEENCDTPTTNDDKEENKNISVLMKDRNSPFRKSPIQASPCNSGTVFSQSGPSFAPSQQNSFVGTVTTKSMGPAATGLNSGRPISSNTIGLRFSNPTGPNINRSAINPGLSGPVAMKMLDSPTSNQQNCRPLMVPHPQNSSIGPRMFGHQQMVASSPMVSQIRPCGAPGPMNTGLSNVQVGIANVRPQGFSMPPAAPIQNSVVPGRPITAQPQPETVRNENYVTVELSNLPLSTTFCLLSEKMAECGQVMLLRLTSPGRAVVQFAKWAHAETCLRQYNGRNILGNIITARVVPSGC